jgi:hypothetical protein
VFEEGGDEISEEGLSVRRCAAEMAVFHASSCHLLLCALRSREAERSSGKFATKVVVAIEIIRVFEEVGNGDLSWGCRGPRQTS